jgi:hypothetical protein
MKAGFEVLTAVSAKMAVLWVVMPYSLLEVCHSNPEGSYL